MRYIISVITLLFFSSLQAQNPNLVWAKNMGGSSGDDGRGIAVDAAGNVYTTGSFGGTADFDPGAGTYILTSAGNLDIFISKVDASGNFVWARNMGGTTADVGKSVTVDLLGNVYTTGSFSGIADFDPGAGIFDLTSSGDIDIFICKLDASGNFVWAKSMEGSFDFEEGLSIKIEASGNVYTTGHFRGTIDFDPGAGMEDITSAGGSDIFISKLDASGNFVWAKAMGGPLDDNGTSIAVDASGNVYTTGFFAIIADFDPGPGTFIITGAGSLEIFISKLDASGNFVWAKNMGGVSGDFGQSIALDAAGNIYTTGTFIGTADFDPGGSTNNLTSVGGTDLFVSKLDASGNFVWAKRMGGVTSDEQAFSIATDASGNVYTTGYFQGTSDFDPGAATFNLTGAGNYDIFISKLDASGNFVWANRMGAISYEVGYSIAVDALNNVYVTGYFFGTVDFNPGAGTFNLTSAGTTDIFVVKLDQTGGLPVTLTNVKAYQKNAGVRVEWIAQQESNIEKYEVERSPNGQQFSKLGTVQATGSSIVINYTLFDPNPFSGVNFYRIKIIDMSGKITYSHVMKVNIKSGATLITVYPNPVNGNTIVLQMNNLRKGSYTLSLTNSLGQQVLTKVVVHTGSSATETIESPNTLAAGIYQVRLTGGEINVTRQIIKN